MIHLHVKQPNVVKKHLQYSKKTCLRDTVNNFIGNKSHKYHIQTITFVKCNILCTISVKLKWDLLYNFYFFEPNQLPCTNNYFSSEKKDVHQTDISFDNKFWAAYFPLQIDHRSQGSFPEFCDKFEKCGHHPKSGIVSCIMLCSIFANFSNKFFNLKVYKE